MAVERARRQWRWCLAFCACLLLMLQQKAEAGLRVPGSHPSEDAVNTTAPLRALAAPAPPPAVYSTGVYVYIFGAPRNRKVPMIVGFKTGNLASYDTNTRSKVVIAITSGVDLSGFTISDVLDAVNWPNIIWIATTTTSITLHLEQTPLKKNTDYEITFQTQVVDSETTFSKVRVEWYNYVTADSSWYKAEENFEDHLVGTTVKTAENVVTSAQVVGAWLASSTIVGFVFEIKMTKVTSGIISILPYPPSGWNFNLYGGNLVDGSPCPTGDGPTGVEGEAMGVRYPSTIAQCYIRKRGQNANSFDLWLLAADLTVGVMVTAFMPLPQAGSLKNWFISYKEWGNSPGYQFADLTISTQGLALLKPHPSASVISTSSNYPGKYATLRLLFQTRLNMIYMKGSRIEVEFDSSVFQIEKDGCKFAADGLSPFGSFVTTASAINTCSLSWRAESEVGTGTIKIDATTGEVSGTTTSFISQKIYGFVDPEGVANGWHYIRVGTTRYIVKNSQVDLGKDIQVSTDGTLKDVRTPSVTKFKTGNFLQQIQTGDVIKAAGREFVVVTVTDDSSVSVTEGGAQPATKLDKGQKAVLHWKSKLKVVGFNEDLPLSAGNVPAGSKFFIEKLYRGVAYWDDHYTVLATGTNAAAGASAKFKIRVYDGLDNDKNGKLDYWSNDFADNYRIEFPGLLGHALLYPTTAADLAKGRVMLAFQTGLSDRLSGGSNENKKVGMLLRITTTHPTKAILLKADGTDFESSTTEATKTDCAQWLLEVWGEGEMGFPYPSHCWWDAWSSAAAPSIYMRLYPRNGFKVYTKYEIVFLATLRQSVNGIKELITVEILDGDGLTCLNYGYAKATKNIVQKAQLDQVEQPILTSLEVIGGDPMNTTHIQFRVKSVSNLKNKIIGGVSLRIFLFPLTMWDSATCKASASDDKAPICKIESVGHNGNVLTLTTDAQSTAIGDLTQTIFTVSQINVPKSGFFRSEIGAEAWFNSPKTGVITATYITSADGRLASNNFASYPVAGGDAYLRSWQKKFILETDNEIILAYRPAATCRSSVDVPCRLTVRVPEGYVALSADAYTTTNATTTNPTGFGDLQLSKPPTCEQQTGTCTFETRVGAALWANVMYGVKITVMNPLLPIAKDSPTNLWTVAISGSNEWGFGQRSFGLNEKINNTFRVLGRLHSASVEPEALILGALTYLRFHFVTTQEVPISGMVRIVAPAGFNFQRPNSDSTKCETQGQVNWPHTVDCNAEAPSKSLTKSVVVLTMNTEPLMANTFYSFDLEVTLPAAEPAENETSHFTILTMTATTHLDYVERVTWSSQADQAGNLIFPRFFSYYPRGLHQLEITIDDMRPYDVTLKATAATVKFGWSDLDILDSPLDVRVYAPATYRWQVHDVDNVISSFNNAPAALGGQKTPLSLFPGRPTDVLRADANVLHLISTQYFKKHTIYGFSVNIRVPTMTPGSAKNPTGGNAFYIAFGAGFPSQKRWAAAKMDFQNSDVRAIQKFEIQTNTRIPGTNSTVTATFKTVTSLPKGGVLQLLLPRSFNFGARYGIACGTDEPQAKEMHPTAKLIPADAKLSCVSKDGRSIYHWDMGDSGLEANRYSVAMYVRNPMTEDESSNSFTVRTYVDSTMKERADKGADVESFRLSSQMPFAQLIISYIDTKADPPIFSARPNSVTFVVFAFQIKKPVKKGFPIKIQAPQGFIFENICNVHVGDGVSWSVLGSKYTKLSPEVTQFQRFPANTVATCRGSGNKADIVVSPAFEGVWTSLPVLEKKAYLFRVETRNPMTTPLLNEWLLNVDGQEYDHIPGYDLHEFRGPMIWPSNTAAGDQNLLTIQFGNRQQLLQQVSSNHALVAFEMPVGFEVMADANLVCLHFKGLFQVRTGGIRNTIEAGCSAMKDANPKNKHIIFLRNKRDVPLVPDAYEFSCLVRNSWFPIAKQNWKFISYKHNSMLETYILDTSYVPAFAVNPKMRSFTVSPYPPGQQNSGAYTSLQFGMVMTQEIRLNDVLVVRGPKEYIFEQSTRKCADFKSNLFSEPLCFGNTAVFSFYEKDGAIVPNVVPFGTPGETSVKFQFSVYNPQVNPAHNMVEFIHCMAVSDKIEPGFNGNCPGTSYAVASAQMNMWAVIPILKDIDIELLIPQVTAQARLGQFSLRFHAVSAGASKLRLASEGYAFGECQATFGKLPCTCTKDEGLDSTLIELPDGVTIPNTEPVEFFIRRIINPLKPQLTKWTISTYDKDEVLIDQARDFEAYTVAGYLELERLVNCKVELLVDRTVSEEEKAGCTTRYPWYEKRDNAVVLKFKGVPDPGVAVKRGFHLCIQPSLGFTFSITGDAWKPLTGFAETAGQKLSPEQYSTFYIAKVDTSAENDKYRSQDQLRIHLGEDMPKNRPFSLKVFVNNPLQVPVPNLWKVSIEDPSGKTRYTNDGDWEAFNLYGVFLKRTQEEAPNLPPALTSVRSLVNAFPSELNTVRVTMYLASALAGEFLMMRIIAPEGFAFSRDCLPAEADVIPKPQFGAAADGDSMGGSGESSGLAVTKTSGSSLVSRPAWVKSCSADRAQPNTALINIVYELSKETEYSTNLLITNSARYDDKAVWTLYTYRNNDLLTFVHFSTVPCFPLRYMVATVLPEVKRFESSSFLHISITPLRDLGPFGQIIINAPDGFMLFCRQKPFFQKGNLPRSCECDGANTFAVIRLSGSDFLERGESYRFAIRVTNPSKENFIRFHGASASSIEWRIRLQTKERDLVHQSTQVEGYAPTDKAITRFSIVPLRGGAGVVSTLLVHFKVETDLYRWRTNMLELQAPSGFEFLCEQDFRDIGWVLPEKFILPANMPRFQDLGNYLERAPPQTSEYWFNDGLTEDLRPIVDCSSPGTMKLAFDFTDSATRGRYAFRVQVLNPMWTPRWNVWMIKSISQGVLLEEGAAGGYTISNSSFQGDSLLGPAAAAHHDSGPSATLFGALLMTIWGSL